MNKSQGVFLASRAVLGASHLVFQTLADACINAEAGIVKRTGYWDEGKQYELSPYQLTQYKAQRRRRTVTLQRKATAKYKELSAMIDKKKELAFKQV